ncbi:MAG: hypothetical protein AAGL98_04170, partial [Planctomycetota bacterium]
LPSASTETQAWLSAGVSAAEVTSIQLGMGGQPFYKQGMETSEYDLSRYAAMVQDLARRAVALAVDASPHQPPPGEVRYSLTESLPAARCLMGAADAAPPPPTERDVTFVDGRGHDRPVYRTLAAYLHQRATGECPGLLRPDDAGDDVAQQLWAAWHALAAGGNDLDPVRRVVEAHDGCLSPQSLDEGPDHWTYRELVGLHVLQALVELCAARDDLEDQPTWRQRIVEITHYHQDHTQPDYTTYQPWGLAAFLSNPETTWFAEQQLHDVATHLRVEGGPGALLPALLLADAFASISS